MNKTEIKKTKRIKKVFSRFDQITHLWAHQIQTDARCRNGFFEEKSIYSYGRHFLAGYIHETKQGKVFCVTTEKYSNTTAKHVRYVQSAIPDSEMSFNGLNPMNLESCIQETQSELIDRLFAPFQKMKFWSGYSIGDKDCYLIEQVEKFNRDVTKLGFKQYILNIDDDFISLVNSHVQRRLDRQNEIDTDPNRDVKRLEAKNKRETLARMKSEKERLEREEKAKTALAEWLNGGTYNSALRAFEKASIRVMGNNVETSQGAELPLAHALRLIRRLDKGLVKQGDAVGSFTVNKIDQDLIVIGCHKLSLSQCRDALKNVTQLQLVVGE